jgi:hypothetical protein
MREAKARPGPARRTGSVALVLLQMAAPDEAIIIAAKGWPF